VTDQESKQVESAVGYTKSDRRTLFFDEPYGKVIRESEGEEQVSISKIQLIRSKFIAYWVQTKSLEWVPLQDLILE
jgi:hypothetical protein